MNMKKLAYILAGVAMVAALASCNRELTFQHHSFISMYGGSKTFAEDAGNITVPVSIYNNKNGATITVKCTDRTAVSGTNYQLVEPASGVLNAAPGDTVKHLDIKLLARPGILDGNHTFNVAIDSKSDDVEVGAHDNVTITIKDNDHPLVDFFGDYTMQAICANSNNGLSYPSWDVEVGPDDADVTHLVFSNMTYFSAVAYNSYTGDCPVYGIVSDDKKTITFPFPQASGSLESGFDIADKAYTFGHTGYGGVYVTEDVEVVFTLDEASGMWITPDSFGISHPSDVASYPDLFYYYAVNYSNFNPNYPTYFQKKQ